MKVSFEKATVEAPVKDVSVECVNTYTSVVPNDPVTFSDDTPGFRDVILPRVNIVQNIGGLKESFEPGEVVFGQTTVLYTPSRVNKSTGHVERPASAPVNLTILGVVSKRFHEIIVGAVGGKIVNTEAEVRAEGGTLDYKEWELKRPSGMKRFGPLLDMLVAIKRPDIVADDDTVFGFSVGADKYALGLWSLSKTSYTNAYKRVFAYHRLAGVLKEGYPMHSFRLTTREEKYPNGNLAWVPVCEPFEKSSPEFLVFAKNILQPYE